MADSLNDLLRALLDAHVELVLVGGLAAVAQGAPVTTFDVNIVHRRSETNVDRLLSVLSALNAYVREPSDRRLRPARSSLLGLGHNLFVTDKGPLDCLGAIEGGLDYEALLAHTLELDLDGRNLHVVSLEMLAQLKEQWPDDESKLRAAILRRALKR